MDLDTSAPAVSVAGPGGADEQFRALGIATIRSTSIKTQGTIGIGSTSIIGVTTTSIVVGDRVRLGIGYSDLYNFIPVDTFVTTIESNTIFINNAATNVGIATSVFEFGRANCGVVTGIAVTYGGGGYLSPPNVTISNEVSEKRITLTSQEYQQQLEYHYKCWWNSRKYQCSGCRLWICNYSRSNIIKSRKCWYWNICI